MLWPELQKQRPIWVEDQEAVDLTCLWASFENVIKCLYVRFFQGLGERRKKTHEDVIRNVTCHYLYVYENT